MNDELIKQFITELLIDRKKQLRENYGVRFHGLTLEQYNLAIASPLSTPLGIQLLSIARAASGETITDQAGVNQTVQDLLETIFAHPGLGYTYEIPQAFWETPLGDTVAAALIWSRGDRLITQAEAAKIAGITIQAINQAIRDGRLTAHPDPTIPDTRRQGRTLVVASEVEEIWGHDES